MGSLFLQILFFAWICIASGYPASDKVSEIVVTAAKVYYSFGEDVVIRCRVSTHNFLGILWHRDKDEACTPDSTWCRQENTTTDEAGIHNSVLHLLQLSANHSYTCVSKMDDFEIKASVVIRVGAKPEILQLAVIPEAPQSRGHQVEVVCRFRSMTTPIIRRMEAEDKLVYETPLTNLAGEEYQLNMTLNPVQKQRLIVCRVANQYGSAEQNITIEVDDRHLYEECTSGTDCVTPNAICNGKVCQCPALLPVAINHTIPNRCLKVLEFGEHCKMSEQCHAADNNTMCDARKRRCLCLSGYSKAKDKCIQTPYVSIGVLLGVGGSLLLMTSSMLGLYFYRKRKEEKELLEINGYSDTYEMETKNQDDRKRVQFEPADIS